MPADELERFGRLVLADPELQRQLRALPDQAAFVTRVVQLAGERGFALTPGDVEEALAASRRAWFERWV